MELTSDLFPQTSKIFTVSELTRQIRGILETKFGAVWVQGEISNYRLQPSGHQYFALKDQRAKIERAAPSRAVVTDFDQPGARAGNGRGAGDRCCYPRARFV